MYRLAACTWPHDKVCHLNDGLCASVVGAEVNLDCRGLGGGDRAWQPLLASSAAYICIFLRRDHFHARHNRAWDGADLVMEVVSDAPADRQRDYEQKLIDYAEAKVAEYWIIDPERQAVVVHQFAGDRYSVHGEYGRGQVAISALLAGFGVDVGALFATAESIPE